MKYLSILLIITLTGCQLIESKTVVSPTPITHKTWQPHKHKKLMHKKNKAFNNLNDKENTVPISLNGIPIMNLMTVNMDNNHE